MGALCLEGIALESLARWPTHPALEGQVYGLPGLVRTTGGASHFLLRGPMSLGGLGTAGLPSVTSEVKAQ